MYFLVSQFNTTFYIGSEQAEITDNSCSGVVVFDVQFQLSRKCLAKFHIGLHESLYMYK